MRSALRQQSDDLDTLMRELKMRGDHLHALYAIMSDEIDIDLNESEVWEWTLHPADLRFAPPPTLMTSAPFAGLAVSMAGAF